ncbi:MAG: YIP1 family protein [Chitinophagaceae bacterium]|nr:YIP1 family protein [Chitinophagaceae bacterium]
MNLIDRVKNIIVNPKSEWVVIDNESTTTQDILKKYVIPLAAVAAVASFIGYGLIGYNTFGMKLGGINWGLYYALSALFGAIVGVLVSAWVIDMLAPSFGSEKNMNKSVQLTAYAYTPAWVGGILAILPSIAWIGSLFSLYGFYLLYVGLAIMKKTPKAQHTSYFVVSLIVMFVVFILVGFVMGKIFMGLFGLSMPVPNVDSLFN